MMKLFAIVIVLAGAFYFFATPEQNRVAQEKLMSLAETAKSTVLDATGVSTAEEARTAIEERNVAADNRAKSLQEKTGLKGESTNMEQVTDRNEVHGELSDGTSVPADQ